MKTILIIIVSLLTFNCYSQPKAYYKSAGVIQQKTRSAGKIQYKVERSGNMSEITNINNKLPDDVCLRKDGQDLSGDMVAMVEHSDPEIIHKIVTNVVKRYSLEIYPKNMSKQEYKEYNCLNSLLIMMTYDNNTGKVLELEFAFHTYDGNYASYIPIEAYEEIEKEIKKQVKATITEEGKTRFNSREAVRIQFKEKK